VIKRGLDALVASVGLLLLSPVAAIAAILVKLDSPGPAIFRQERIGRRFRPFVLYKFRTMGIEATTHSSPITVGNDARVTRVGRTLRRTKIDELPQLWNVLKGDMSFVGPRPELREFVELFRQEYAEILEARPGITDLASIKYHDEASLLAGAAHPEEEYVRMILPDKIRLARESVRRSSIAFDLTVIAKTLVQIARGIVAV
jgi:lipopolysaccharide/colanic/teichoic acid biosynthesis glycosyltransferase